MTLWRPRRRHVRIVCTTTKPRNPCCRVRRCVVFGNALWVMQYVHARSRRRLSTCNELFHTVLFCRCLFVCFLTLCVCVCVCCRLFTFPAPAHDVCPRATAQPHSPPHARFLWHRDPAAVCDSCRCGSGRRRRLRRRRRRRAGRQNVTVWSDAVCVDGVAAHGAACLPRVCGPCRCPHGPHGSDVGRLPPGGHAHCGGGGSGAVAVAD